jgi:hypothetical protein
VWPAPFRGRGVLAVLKWRHSVTELTPASSHSPPQWWGWASPRELAKQRRGVIPRRVVAWLCCVRALNARTRAGEGTFVRDPQARRSPPEGA